MLSKLAPALAPVTPTSIGFCSQGAGHGPPAALVLVVVVLAVLVRLGLRRCDVGRRGRRGVSGHRRRRRCRLHPFGGVVLLAAEELVEEAHRVLLSSVE